MSDSLHRKSRINAWLRPPLSLTNFQKTELMLKQPRKMTDRVLGRRHYLSNGFLLFMFQSVAVADLSDAQRVQGPWGTRWWGLRLTPGVGQLPGSLVGRDAPAPSARHCPNLAGPLSKKHFPSGGKFVLTVIPSSSDTIKLEVIYNTKMKNETNLGFCTFLPVEKFRWH